MSEKQERKPRARKAVEPKYNLQVPIDKGTEAKLREMASEMGLNLTQYARWVLIQHTKGVEVKPTIIKTEPTIVVGEQTTNNEGVTKPKIKKGFGGK